MVYYVDGIPGTEAVAAQQRLALLLSNKLKQEYFEMCGFIKAGISLATSISNTLLLRGSREKDAYIFQRTDMGEGVVMALIVLWRVYVSQRLGRRRLYIQAAGGQKI